MLFVFCAKYIKEIVGVEISGSAIHAANCSLEKNKTSNIEFHCADSESFLLNYAGQRVDLMLFNPPRRGLSEAIIEQVVALRTRSIIYSSCNAESFLRDYQKLSTSYQIQEIHPIDMFPMTSHLESLSLLKLIDE